METLTARPQLAASSGAQLARLVDAFWRAAAYCLHPRVIALSLLPLLVAGVLAFGFMYFFWEDAVAGVRATMEQWLLVESLLRWLDAVGANAFRTALAPIFVLALALPVIVVTSLLLVALCMTPAIVNLVAARRFAQLEKRHGGSALQSALRSLGATALALLVLLLSLPLWLIPPLVLVLPPLIWGWLAYQVFGFDVLAAHASAQERRALLRTHRLPLLAIGVVSGYLGAAPSLIWAFGAIAIVLAPFLVLLSVWLYTLAFAFSSAWFTHYALSALQALRAATPGEPGVPPAALDVLNLPPPSSGVPLLPLPPPV